LTQNDDILDGYICTKLAQTLAVEVVVQAVRDYRRLVAHKKATMKLDGATTPVTGQKKRIKQFFTNGGADSWLELAGVNVSGRIIWKQISQQPGRVTGEERTNRTLLG